MLSYTWGYLIRSRNFCVTLSWQLFVKVREIEFTDASLFCWSIIYVLFLQQLVWQHLSWFLQSYWRTAKHAQFSCACWMLPAIFSPFRPISSRSSLSKTSHAVAIIYVLPVLWMISCLSIMSHTVYGTWLRERMVKVTHHGQHRGWSHNVCDCLIFKNWN